MKNTLITISLLLSLSSWGQIITHIEDITFDYPKDGYYYKDINYLLDPFVGTYLYTNGNTSFKIVLKKMIQSSCNDYYYEDLIIGAYQYIENGVEKVNTLSELNNTYSDGIKYPICGNQILRGSGYGWYDIPENAPWLKVSISDPIRDGFPDAGVEFMFVRKLTNPITGDDEIKIGIHHTGGVRGVGDPAPPAIRFPFDLDLILVKQ
jgi:hypothetical protein